MEQMLEATAGAEDRHFWFTGMRRHARQMLDTALGGRVVRVIVDCGTGTGRNLDWLQRYGFAVGIERSPVGLRLGRARRTRLVQGTVTALPVASESADIVTSFDVLYCLDDASEAQAIAEMFRVLKPGGIALINVAALDILRGAHSTLTHEVRRYTRTRLAARLEEAGFRPERLTYTNMMTFPITLASRLTDRLTGRDARPSAVEFTVPPAPINALLDAALAVEAGLAKVVNLPVGSSIMAVAKKPL
ncbi:MAG TPA: methyltransferase domain-containing protein [Vicinamibacterales bacterium]|nr:methyltransferase domain-containing protein [Vicinamibacterales bacterium]